MSHRIDQIMKCVDVYFGKSPRPRHRGTMSQDEKEKSALVFGELVIQPGIIAIALEDPEIYRRARIQQRCSRCPRMIQKGQPCGRKRTYPRRDDEGSAYWCEACTQQWMELHSRITTWQRWIDEYNVALAPPGPNRVVTHSERVDKAINLIEMAGTDDFIILDQRDAEIYQRSMYEDDCDTCGREIHKGDFAAVLRIVATRLCKRNLYWCHNCWTNQAPTQLSMLA